jgi:CHAT domain-containing protein/uncharacterized protein HemY
MRQSGADVCKLELNRPVTRDLAAGRSDACQLNLNSASYVRLSVTQNGIDIRMTISGPDGRLVVQADSLKGTVGPMPASLVSDGPGIFTVGVQATGPDGGSGTYGIRIEELREAAPADQARVAAQRIFWEGEELRRNQSAAQDAAKKYEEAIPLARSAGDQREEADAVTGLARAYDALGDKQKALQLYDQGLALHKTTGNRAAEASTLNSIGLVYDYLGKKEKALDCMAEALKTARAAADRQVEAIAINNTGVVYYGMGEKQKALDLFNQSLAINKELGNRREQATILTSIGTAYGSMREYKKALSFLSESLALRRQIGNKRETALALNNIGVVYVLANEYEPALEYYQQALPLWRQASDRNGEAACLHNMASIYDQTGEYRKAIEYYDLALKLNRAVNFQIGVANTLTSLGQLYNKLGDYGRALDLLNEALPIHRAASNRQSEMVALHTIGSICRKQGDWKKALETLDQALVLAREVKDPKAEAETLAARGEIFAAQGDNTRALELLTRALSISEAIGSPHAQAATQMIIGRIYSSDRQWDKAREFYLKGLALFQAMGTRYDEAAARWSIAANERDAGRLVEARSSLEAARAIKESVRSNVPGQNLRSYYNTSTEAFYELEIDVLMQLHKQNPDGGYCAEAFDLSERGRARGLIEMLREAEVDLFKVVEPSLLEQQRALQHLLNAKAEQQSRFLSGKYDQQRAAAIAKELDELTVKYRDLETKIAVTSPRYAALTAPQPLSLRQIQETVLDPDSLLLEYSLGAERSYLWAVSRDSIASFELPSRKDIEAAAMHFYELVSREDSGGADDAASTLTRMLLLPAAGVLGNKRLVIVADGGLNYIPFSVLPSPSSAGLNTHHDLAPGEAVAGRSDLTPLIAERETVYLPSASTLAVIRSETAGRAPAPKTVAVFADPVFTPDDSRLTASSAQPADERRKKSTTPGDLARSMEESGTPDSGASLPRLIGSRREAAAIMALVPPGERKEALDFQANLQVATSPELGEYRIVHFATHGVLNSRHPELSGIVLSLVNERGEPVDGFLRLNEIYNLKLPTDLTVLSACRTALGTDIKGEGLVGLTRGFMYAGSPRIAASLWKVDDAAAADLMKRFYQAMLGKDHLRPAAALRQAQIEMWKQKRWQSPYYWGAFVLQGEWR